MFLSGTGLLKANDLKVRPGTSNKTSMSHTVTYITSEKVSGRASTNFRFGDQKMLQHAEWDFETHLGVETGRGMFSMFFEIKSQQRHVHVAACSKTLHQERDKIRIVSSGECDRTKISTSHVVKMLMSSVCGL